MRILIAIALLSTISACAQSPAASDRIALGNENLESILPLLKSKSVAILGNHTSVLQADINGTPTHLVDTLIALDVNIIKAFAPEHGFRGKEANGAHIIDGVDSKTGLPILSLHGKHRKPSKESLEGVDLIIFDIQDVGARFYTYLSTLLLVMEASIVVTSSRGG